MAFVENHLHVLPSSRLSNLELTMNEGDVTLQEAFASSLPRLGAQEGLGFR
jgi:hypothetical protein